MSPVTEEQSQSVRAAIQSLGSDIIAVRDVVLKDDSDADGDAVLVTVSLAPLNPATELDADEFLRIRREARSIAAHGLVDKEIRVVYESNTESEAADSPASGGGDKGSGSGDV